jgi:uncharacterized protein YbjT (DUF2867 family)
MDIIKEAINALPGFDNKPGKILVLDPNGVIGYRVASRLLDSGNTVRLGCADSEVSEVSKLVSKGAEIKEFVWEKDYTFANALTDIHSVYVAFPAQGQMEDLYPKFILACKKAHVKHVVQLSFFHAVRSESTGMQNFATMTKTNDPFHNIPMIKIHGWCDERLVKSRLNYTILFATHLMSNPLRYQSEQIRKEGKFYGASGGRGVNYISPNDCAEAVVVTLLHPKDHYHQGYTLTGSKAITDEHVAELISKAENKPVTFVDTLPTEGVDPDFMGLEHVKATGAEEDVSFVSKDFVKLCGHEQEPYEAYIANKAAMSPKELLAFQP